MKLRLSSIRVFLAALCAAGPAVSAVAQESSFLPPSYTADRYEAVAKTNPFVLEEEAKAPEEPPPWEFSLAGVSRIEGKYAVWLANTDAKAEPKDRYIRLVEGAEAQSGFQLVSVKFDPNPRKLEAVVKRGAEQRSITYDEKRLEAKPEARPAAPAANQPGGRPGNPQARQQPGQGRPPTRANQQGGRGRQEGGADAPRRSRVIMPPGLNRSGN